MPKKIIKEQPLKLRTIVDARLGRIEEAMLFLLKDHVVIYVRRLQLDENDAFAKDELSKINALIAALEK